MDDTIFVLDSSAFLSGKPLFSFCPMITTGSVREELTRLGEEVLLARYPELDYDAPTPHDIEEVRGFAERTGDLRRLSPVDIELVALALKLGGTVISDDYSIQNVCGEAQIPFLPLSERGIQRKVKWGLRCRGCNRYFDGEATNEKLSQCPVCGSELRTVRTRSAGL